MSERPSHHTGEPGSSWANPIHYRGYRIYLSMVQHEAFAYEYVHEDYDGAEDANDSRYGHAPSIEACKAEIDEREDDA